VRNLSYDALNRKTGETWVVSGSTVNTQTFTYDAADNQLTAQDQSGAYTMAYDTLNRMTSEQEPFGQVLTFSYDAATNRTQVNDSQSGVTTSVYDALGRLTSRKFSNGTTNLRIDPGWTNRDQLASLKRYTDLGGSSLVGMSSYTYDAAERLTALTHTYASGSVLASYAYGYDQASRLTSETINGTQTTYGYDNTDQLTTVNGVATYSYDLNGNRTMTGYATGSANEMTNDGTFTYTYDSEGNLTQKSKGTNLETWYYGYDNLNRLTSVRKTSDGTTNQVTATYTYDVYGDRIEQDEWVKPQSGNGVTTVTRFAYDGGNVWADLNSSNQLTMRRLYLDGVDQPFARVDSNNVAAWYLTDHLGSIRDVMDKAGATDLDQVVYDAYGNITSESAPTSGDRYKYTGREWDGNTGLQYNRARYFDPKIGRWVSQDTLGFGAGDGNLYRYVHDEPTNATDASGMQEQSPLSIEPGIVVRGPYGQFAWPIRWKLSKESAGWVIQELTIKETVNDKTIIDVHYYEAFKFKKGQLDSDYWKQQAEMAVSELKKFEDDNPGKDLDPRFKVIKDLKDLRPTNMLEIINKNCVDKIGDFRHQMGQPLAKDFTRFLNPNLPLYVDREKQLKKGDDYFSILADSSVANGMKPTSGKTEYRGNAFFVATDKKLPKAFTFVNGDVPGAGFLDSANWSPATEAQLSEWLKVNNAKDVAKVKHNLDATWTKEDPLTKVTTTPATKPEDGWPPFPK